MKSQLSLVPWRWVFLYYVLALGLAIPINLGWMTPWLRTHFPGTILADWSFLPAALGPAVGALVVRHFGPRPTRTTSILGISPSRTLVTALIPVGLFTLVDTRAGLYAFVALSYALGEELGWRGFLADSLAPLRGPWSLAITSVLWWFWHLRFTTTFDWLVLPPIIVVSSLALGHAARTSGSVLVAAAMHALIISLTASGTPGTPMLLAGCASLAAWILLGTVWPLPQPAETT